jgi:hypothetical protein
MNTSKQNWLLVLSGLFLPIGLGWLAGRPLFADIGLGVFTSAIVLAVLIWGRKRGATYRETHSDQRLSLVSRKLFFPGLALTFGSFLWFGSALLIVPHTIAGEYIAVIPFILLLIPGAVFVGLRFCVAMLEMVSGK